MTDYPDKDLMDNIHENIERNTTPEERDNVVNVQVRMLPYLVKEG